MTESFKDPDQTVVVRHDVQGPLRHLVKLVIAFYWLGIIGTVLFGLLFIATIGL